jgi:hypothetical protein
LAKAGFFNENRGGYQRVTAVGNWETASKNVNVHGMVAHFLKSDDFVKVFRRTHQRLYSAFGRLDDDLKNCDPGFALPWADTYSRWMIR